MKPGPTSLLSLFFATNICVMGTLINMPLSSTSSINFRPRPLMPAATSTTTVMVLSTTDESTMELRTSTPSLDESSMQNTTPLPTMENTNASRSDESPKILANTSYAMPSSALYPINTFEIPYALEGGNYSYVNASVYAETNGLSFLLSSYSSDGLVHTTNLGVIVPAGTQTAFASGLDASASFYPISNLGGSKTHLATGTRTVVVYQTVTMRVDGATSLEAPTSTASADSETSTRSHILRAVQSEPVYPKNLVQPMPVVDLQPLLRAAAQKNAVHQVKGSGPPTKLKADAPSTSAGLRLLVPAMPAVAAIALAGMLASGKGFQSFITDQEPVTTETLGAAGILSKPRLSHAPIHYVNGILTPVTTMQTSTLTESEGEPISITSQASIHASSSAAGVSARNENAPSLQAKREAKGGGAHPAPRPVPCHNCFSKANATVAPFSSTLALFIGLLIMAFLMPAARAAAIGNIDVRSLSNIPPPFMPTPAAIGFDKTSEAVPHPTTLATVSTTIEDPYQTPSEALYLAAPTFYTLSTASPTHNFLEKNGVLDTAATQPTCVHDGQSIASNYCPSSHSPPPLTPHSLIRGIVSLPFMTLVWLVLGIVTLYVVYASDIDVIGLLDRWWNTLMLAALGFIIATWVLLMSGDGDMKVSRTSRRKGSVGSSSSVFL